MKRYYGEVYAYRARRPSGIGRHLAYVGKTTNGARRHRQHMGTMSRESLYWQPGQPWADLDPKRYVLLRIRRRGLFDAWRLSIAEAAAIRLLLPVYNVQRNAGNPRRIKPHVAKRQRALRDSGHRVLASLRLVPMAVAALALMVALAGWWLR
ncbi:MAG TPA: hypothetical protein VFU47_12990 [Armatimonadota bacterium]|nr:hypothetical protein [Armatimonadota bacterium]